MPGIGIGDAWPEPAGLSEAGGERKPWLRKPTSETSFDREDTSSRAPSIPPEEASFGRLSCDEGLALPAWNPSQSCCATAGVAAGAAMADSAPGLAPTKQNFETNSW